MTTYLDLHVLQTVPPSNINRDDTGSPKTAVFGGVRRARVSSQAWKRAIRLAFTKMFDEADLGVRSKRLVDLVAERIGQLDANLTEQAEELAVASLTALGITLEKPRRKKGAPTDEPDGVSESGYLIFMSRRQIDNLARAAVASAHAGEKPNKKELQALVNKDHSVDLALFGRMVADLSDLQLDASTQVAHAISVHGVTNEFDYFTAVDDHSTGEHAGASMIGTVEFNSSTLYRYATVNLDALHANLGDVEATTRATRAFVEAFVRSLPTGKQNTFANRTLPHAVVAFLRDDQPINLAAAFETPVQEEGATSRLTRAAEAFVTHATAVHSAYGAPNRTWTLAASAGMDAISTLGPTMSLTELIDGVGQAAQASLAES